MKVKLTSFIETQGDNLRTGQYSWCHEKQARSYINLRNRIGRLYKKCRKNRAQKKINSASATEKSTWVPGCRLLSAETWNNIRVQKTKRVERGADSEERKRFLEKRSSASVKKHKNMFIWISTISVSVSSGYDYRLLEMNKTTSTTSLDLQTGHQTIQWIFPSEKHFQTKNWTSDSRLSKAELTGRKEGICSLSTCFINSDLATIGKPLPRQILQQQRQTTMNMKKSFRDQVKQTETLISWRPVKQCMIKLWTLKETKRSVKSRCWR